MEENEKIKNQLNTSNKCSTRINWIDACKGFAIFLVVVGHVSDVLKKGSTFENYNNQITLINNFIYSFHMALFFLISGYTFKIAYLKEDKIKKDKIKTQLINIFIIFTFFTILQWGIKYIFRNMVYTEYTIKDLLLMYIKPMRPYWYLLDLFVFYILGMLLYKYRNNWKIIILITLLVSFVGNIFSAYGEIEIFRCMKFLVFFVIGTFWDNIKKDNFKIFVSILLICFVNMIYIVNNVEPIKRIIYIINALAITYIIVIGFSKIKILGDSKILNYLGQHSLEIYVLHCFFISSNRIILSKIGITNFYINFTLNCIFSTLLPILCSIICRKFKIYNYIFTPGKVIQARKEEKIH